jgi:hypothetical protein
MCAAAAGSVLTSFGIATIGIEPWFIPAVALLLLIGLWGFWQSSRTHGQIWPFIVATISSGAVVVGRLLGIPVLLWVATIALAIAYICDWLIKKRITNL